MEDGQYLLGALGVTFILSLSAYGSCEGMMNCGTSSALHAINRTVLTYSYVAMIMISTVFFYGFILAIVIINKIGSTYTLHSGIMHLVSGILFGTVGMFAGKSMGTISKHGFKRIVQNSKFYTSFMIALASVEVTLVISFLCSLLVVYKL